MIKTGKFEIINLDFKQTARQWWDAQAVKPDEVLNGSLWAGTPPHPIGTVFIGGKLIYDSGNGDGFGIDKNGVPCFGRAYGAIAWREVLTSYPGPAPICGGNKRSIEAKPEDGANALRPRSCVYKTASGEILLRTIKSITIAELRDKLHSQGVTDLIMVDGGESCFNAIGGKIVYESAAQRKLANIIVKWPDSKEDKSLPTYSKKTDLDKKLTTHFKVGEFRCGLTKACPSCSEIIIDSRLPEILEDIREQCGNKPIRINSGYRCLVYNAGVAGASPNSNHMNGIAADIQITGVDTTTICKAAEKALARLGIPGGIGRYIGQSFVHVDVRASRSRWQQDKAGQSTYAVPGWGEVAQLKPTLKRGSTGAEVKYMQQCLIAHGVKLNADGIFGSDTESKLKTFQGLSFLAADGICGPKTWAKLEV